MIHWIFLGLSLLAIISYVIAERANLYSTIEDIASVALWVGAVGAFLVGVIWGTLALGSAECGQIERSTGYETEFYAIGGCFVVIEDGREIPVDERSVGFIVEGLTE